jgi:hypothetical protein
MLGIPSPLRRLGAEAIILVNARAHNRMNLMRCQKSYMLLEINMWDGQTIRKPPELHVKRAEPPYSSP